MYICYMDFVFTILIIFVAGGWFFGKLVGESIFPKSSGFEIQKPSKKSTTIINNTYIQNNLNVTEEQFEKLKDSIKS